MRAKILNRNASIPSDGWYHIEVTGTHPAGKGRKQLIDQKALESIVNRFKEERDAAGDEWEGMLVDLDHLSHNLANSTEAYAWLQEVEIRNHKSKPQLFGRMDLTDLGEKAVKNKRVKWFSTEYDPDDLEPAGDGIVRPLRLAGLAFTNRPNNRGGTPISNRTDDPGGEPETEDKPKAPMKPIAEALGLSADADEAAILAKIAELQSKVTTAETKEKEAKADEILNTYKGRIPEESRASWRSRLITNRADTEQLLQQSFPVGSERKPQKPIHNRDTATNPEPLEGREDSAKEQAEARAIRNRAEELQKASNGRRDFGSCWNQAESEQAARQ